MSVLQEEMKGGKERRSRYLKEKKKSQTDPEKERGGAHLKMEAIKKKSQVESRDPPEGRRGGPSLPSPAGNRKIRAAF